MIPSSVFFISSVYCILYFFLVVVHSFYFLFHALLVPTVFLVVVIEFLEHPFNHFFELCVWWFACLNFIWLLHWRFSIGEHPFRLGVLSLPLHLSDFSGLFLHFRMFCFASCLCGVNFCIRVSLWFSGAVTLISLSGCCRVALSSVCVGSLIVLVHYMLVASLLEVLPSTGLIGSGNSHLVMYAVVQVIFNKAVLPNNQTYTSKKDPPTIY